MNHALDFALATNYGIEFAIFGTFREVTPKGLECWSFGFALLWFAVAGILLFFRIGKNIFLIEIIAFLLFLSFVRRCEVRINLGENFVAGALNVDVELLQHTCGDAVTFAQQT